MISGGQFRRAMEVRWRCGKREVEFEEVGEWAVGCCLLFLLVAVHVVREEEGRSAALRGLLC